MVEKMWSEVVQYVQIGSPTKRWRQKKPTLKNVDGHNVERKNAKCYKTSNGKKRLLGQNIE